MTADTAASSSSSGERAQLTARWAELGIEPASAQHDPAATLGRAYAATIAAPQPNAIFDEALADAVPDGGIAVGPVLGEGGMGVVRLAEQRSLRRFVAVKQPHPHRARADAVHNLLREAWVGGSLEHPNIVPIHALAQRDGDPMIVMKHIEGRSWADVLRAPDERHDLEWHLQVLMHVCHAVHFAHARGVLHLDLKPDNVMLGEFGEVYLLDWGVAVSIRDDRPAWMPAARDVRHILGTPRYLSPEQAAGDGAQFGRTTDVFLLGAILFEIVTGEPIHGRRPTADAVLHAWRAPAPPLEGVPAELAGIIRRATARHPGDRYPTAERLRLAIEQFIRHRESAQLVQEAQARIEALREGTGDWVRAVTECRFGLSQALRIWPENAEARAALQTMGALEVHQALTVRDVARARAALAELPDPDPALAAAVDALIEARQAEAREVERLRALEQQVDRNSHHLLRSRWCFGLGVLWFIWNVVSAWLFRSGRLPLTHEVMLYSTAFALVSVGVGVWVVRRNILTTEINRRALALLAVHMVGAVLVWFTSLRHQLPVAPTVLTLLALYSTFCWSLAVAVDLRLWTVATVTTVLSLIGAGFGEHPFEVVAVVGGALSLGVGAVWRKPVPNEA